MTAGYTYLWEFIVEPGQREEFQRQYGPGGPWIALFRRAPGYLETRLLRDRADPRRFITIDRWTSAAAHRSFRSAFAREYAELDARCAHLSTRETALGEFADTPRSRAAHRLPVIRGRETGFLRRMRLTTPQSAARQARGDQDTCGHDQ